MTTTVDYSGLLPLKNEAIIPFDEILALDSLRIRFYWGGLNDPFIEAVLGFSAVMVEGTTSTKSAIVATVPFRETFTAPIHQTQEKKQEIVSAWFSAFSRRISSFLADMHVFQKRDIIFKFDLSELYERVFSTLFEGRFCKGKLHLPDKIIERVDEDENWKFTFGDVLLMVDAVEVKRHIKNSSEAGSPFNRITARWEAIKAGIKASDMLYKPGRDNVFARRARKMQD